MARPRIYTVKVDFFEKWSHKMAYILGFITADGNVSNLSLGIDLAFRDEYLLKFIRDNICPNKQIEERHSLNSRRLRIHSIELVKSLEKYGIVKRKGNKIKLDFNIPKRYLGDYLRGIFDGDGWVYCRRNMIESGICSASEGFLEELKKRSGNIGKNRKIRKRIKKGYTSPLYNWEMGKEDSLKLRDLMYNNDCFSLKRKKERFFSNFHIPSEKYWTKEQINKLIENWNIPLKNLTGIMNRSYKSITKKRWELRMAKDERIQKWEKVRISKN